MRYSGWSSLAISVFSALVLAAPASAHLSITPDEVHTGALVDLVFSVPNEHGAYGVDHVTIGVPQDFVLDDAEAKPGWQQSRTGQAITWDGGNIPKHEFARFAIRGTAPATAERVLFNVLVGDRTGKSITYQVPLTVLSHGPQDAGARTLGKAGLAVAIVAGALALAALFVALAAWLRPPPP
jgi:uncharacterized protein YcnI